MRTADGQNEGPWKREGNIAFERSWNLPRGELR